ncbi:MAG: DUF4032 domain-containing protein [Candidatus Sericytochromatia bacterium]
MSHTLLSSAIRPGFPDFLELPWQLPFADWAAAQAPVEQRPIGICRHPVIFVRQQGHLYALKELPETLAEQEYQLLRRMEELHLPAVTPVGHLRLQRETGPVSVVVTDYLDHAVPYRHLFVAPDFDPYREHLLDAMASLLVQLHLSGVFWGDCSLSNALFRQDAGRLQAYLVDAETSEVHDSLSDALRDYELEIMEENIAGSLADLAAAGELPSDYPVFETGSSIRERYQRLWHEITHTEKIPSDQKYRIQERIRTLNALGFSVDEVMLQPMDGGDRLQFRVMVTDRQFHQQLLQGLTGLETEEQQAQRMINEIQELRAGLSQRQNRSTPLSVAAAEWLETVYRPTIERLEAQTHPAPYTPVEVYCLMLEHKWYLSEKAAQDVGHQKALHDFLERVLPQRSGRPDADTRV